MSSCCMGQYTPYFQNFSLSEYNAGNQNWGLSKGNNGKLYVANNNGLLVFDGLKWTLNEIPNKTTLRSVLAVDERIYVGSYEEFGFFKRNNKGLLEYSSLSRLIKTEFFNEEFWQIVAYKDMIVFRSFLNIYIYKDNQITRVKPTSTVLSCDVVNDVMYVSTLNGGIFILKDGTLQPFITNELLDDTKVVSIDQKDDGLFITTSLKGCYLYQKGKLLPWDTDINVVLKEQQLNSVSMLKDGKMAFGTIKNGLYVTNRVGKIIYHISKENGLMNNTILSQFISNKDELWLGLDNGIASVNLNSPHVFYNDVTGKLGAVYDVTSFKGTIYIGSNTGLYYIDAENTLQFIEDSQGQVWELKIINNELLCGHNNGTYLVENKKIKLISNQTGGWVLKKVPEQSNVYVQGTYAGFVKFENTGDNWQVSHLGRPTNPFRFLVFEDDHTAWAAHAYKGVYKAKFDKDFKQVVDVKNYGNKGLKSEYNVRVYKIKSDICFKTNEGWQKYEPLLDSIVPYDLLNDSFGKHSYIIYSDEDDIFAVKSKNLIEFKSFANSDYKNVLSDKYFKKRLIVGYEKISKINDSIYALNLNDGFMLINKNSTSEIFELEKPEIEMIEVDKSNLELNQSNSIEIPFKNKNISISLSSPNSSNHFFEYSVSNIDASHWYSLENEKLEFSNLGSGDYKILFRTANFSGQKSPTTSIEFHVLPPWYRTGKGFAAFFIMALILSVIIYALHRRKIKKEQELIKHNLELEQKEILKEKNQENERKIVELKNEALKSEVTLKSKQLANTAMALIKKNETLLELKNELQQNKKHFDNPFSFRKLLNKVDHSIEHKDEWNIFEYNFNQVHEEFFVELKRRYPQLTHKDLKICAYIKMNLSTKEIAPLLNISARGVETQRYRLKGKLGLDSDDNLTNYLVNFK